MSMLCAINTELFSRLSPREACAAIRDAGFAAIDWSLNVEADRDDLAAQLSAIRESGLRVVQASLPSPLFDQDDSVRTAHLVECATEMIRLCHDAGCAYLIVPPISRQKEYGLSIADVRTRNVETYAALIPAAKEYGVTVCLENEIVTWWDNPYAGCCTYPEEAVELIDTLNAMAGKECFGLCLNTGHLDLARSDFYAYLYKTGSRIKALHLNDNYGVKNDRIIPMTGGIIAWNYVCRALRSNGYRGDISLDVSMAPYADSMIPSALRLAADSARELQRRIEEG